MEEPIPGVPTVIGRYRDRKAGVSVVCPWCHKKHCHGRLTPGVPEHRANDCDRSTKGYYVVLKED